MAKEIKQRKVVPVSIELDRIAHNCKVKVGDAELAVTRIEIDAKVGHATEAKLHLNHIDLKRLLDNAEIGMEVADQFGSILDFHKVRFIEGEFQTTIEIEQRNRDTPKGD